MSRGRAIGDVRPSQVITTFGPGAIVDLQTLSVIVAGIDDWPTDGAEAIQEPRLQHALNVGGFFPALPAKGSIFNKQGTVPCFLFPRYQVCSNSKCATLSEFGDGLTDYDKKWQDIRCKAPQCPGRGKFRAPTNPAPFVVACPGGHIDDFPWRIYVHRNPSNCRGRMQLFSRGKTGSVADLIVQCDCGASRSVSDAFGVERSEILGECTRRRPWLGTKNRDATCTHKDNVRAIQRGATNAWFPIVRSALSIKEAATPIGMALKMCPHFQIGNLNSIEDLEAMIRMGMLPALDEFDVDDVWQTIKKSRRSTESDETDLRLPEWNAFRDITEGNQSDDSDFFLEAGEVPSFASDSIERVVLVRKLLEVRSLTGFTRIDYWSGSEATELGPARAPIYRNRPDWLPAVEVRGEGIFLELNEKKVAAWESSLAVMNRAGAMERKYKEWAIERGVGSDDFPGARYVLLHTLAHVLIRQLALDCGYSAASVRERIYSSNDPKRRMCGMLLYTASPDSEGSLGGLVDLGSPSRFPFLFRDALRRTTRCSSDPLCADHQPDVHATINGAACHACVLAPETSCETFNRFLDRNFLVPSMAHNNMAYFSEKTFS